MAKKKNKQVSNKKINKKSKNQLGMGFFIIPLVLIIFSYAFIFTILQKKYYIYISPVFKNYTALEKNEDKPLENYFQDDIELFYEEKRHYLINDAAEYLYDKTGVKAFVYCLSATEDKNGNSVYPTDDEAVETCKKICNEFSDEGIDLTILFIPTPEGYKCWTYSTDNVKAEFGNKFEKVLKQTLRRNFCTVGEYDDLFIFTYRDTADRMMDGFTSPLLLIKENFRIFLLSITAIIIVVPSVIFYKRAEKK